ncbi:MAG: methyl-accepting chemotaxis protein [Brevinema sp.]
MSQGIISLSLYTRKKMRTTILVKLYLFTIFVLFPLNLLQEFFVLPYIIPDMVSAQNIPLALYSYFSKHYILHTASLLFIGSCFGAYIFLAPYLKYIATGQDTAKIQKKIINPLGLVLYFLVLPNICNTINLILDFNYISSLPIQTIIYFFTFKTLWQIAACFLAIFYFFSITENMRDTLGLYTFHTSKWSFFPVFKITLIVLIQLILFSLIVFEVLHFLDSKKYTADYISFWALIMIAFSFIIVNILLHYQNNINTQIKQQLYLDVKNLVSSGDFTNPYTYYEQNLLGSFISEYNRFISYLKKEFQQITVATQALQEENQLLRENTAELISTLSQQEINVTQMNIATNTTCTTIQYLLSEVNTQSKILRDEQHTMDNLISGTKNISETFQSITTAYQLSQEANNKALEAVEKSLVKTELMNQNIATIHNKIHTAGLETSAIDEVLGIIKNISEQTNLLSMSAAIEAAHGDASRKGFTLVAEEIRKLAQMSQESVSKIANRLSTITEYINDAHNMSKENIELSKSSLSTGGQLKTSIAKIAETSKALQNITEQAQPITQEQNELILQFQYIINNMRDFLDHLIQELKKESSTSVVLSLNFRTMIQNFKKGQSSLYYIETNLEKLNMIESHLKDILQEVKLQQSNEEYHHE